MTKQRTFLFILFYFVCCASSLSQKNLNLDFEKLDSSAAFPLGLQLTNMEEKGYSISIDSITKQHGKYSVSINQTDPKGDFKAIYFKIDPRFKGEKIKLIGYVKTENVLNGFAGLWLRIDGDGETLEFDNMSNRGIKGTTDWTEYTTELDLHDDEARAIFVGGLLVGNGKMWIDNLQILVDGHDIATLPEQLDSQKTIIDSALLNSTQLQFGKMTKQEIENLTNLGMLWGFLKYYHPAIGDGRFNMDAALFKVLPDVLQSKSKEEFNVVLEKWIDGFGKVDPCKKCKTVNKDSSIKLMPDYGWLFKQNNLGSSVISKLEYIKNNRHLGKGYYIDKTKGVGNPIFKHEDAYGKMQNPDAAFRLLSLFRYWNMIQYFFPYKHLIGEDWNNVLPEFIPKFLKAKDSIEYVTECLALIARVHDTHANIWGNNELLKNFRGKYFAPVQGKFISNKLVVTDYYTDTLGIKDKIKIGDIITHINGKKVEDLIKENLYRTPASNYETQLRNLPKSALLRSKIDSMNIEIEREGKKIQLSLQLFDQNLLDFKKDYDPSPNDSSYKIINGNISYVFPGKYKNSQLKDIAKKFADTRGIIVDMRTYPSEFMPFTFGNYIKDQSTPFVKFTIMDLDLPGTFRFGTTLNNGGGNNGYIYKKPVIVIVNSTSQSQAEYTTMAFQSAPNVTVIGSTTAGADGNVSAISLPGGISTMISGIGVYYPDGTETQRKGVKIDLIMYPTINGIKEGRDELLGKAIELINNHPQ